MYDEDLHNLENWVRRLKVEYDIYFNGHRKRPPDDLRMRVEKIVKRLSEASDMSYSQRFRYTTLVARYHVFKDLWRRIELDRESAKGVLPPGQQPADEPASAKSSRPGVQVTIDNPATEQDKIMQLYKGLLRMRGMHEKDSPAPSFQEFAKYVTAQALSIKKKHRCGKVVFRLLLDENTIKFTAKADHKT